MTTVCPQTAKHWKPCFADVQQSGLNLGARRLAWDVSGKPPVVISAAACGRRRPRGALYEDEGEKNETVSASSSSSELSLPGRVDENEEPKLRPIDAVEAILAFRIGGGSTGADRSMSVRDRLLTCVGCLGDKVDVGIGFGLVAMVCDLWTAADGVAGGGPLRWGGGRMDAPS